MSQYAEECRVARHPATSTIRASRWRACPATSCATGSTGAAVVISNDYEFELLCEKTGLDEAGVLAQAETLVVTLGEHGCKVVQPRRHDRRAGGAAGAHRRSDRRRRRVPRRADEGPGGRRRLGDLRAARQRRRRPTRSSTSAARATPTRRRVPRPLRAALRRARAAGAGGGVTTLASVARRPRCLAASLLWLAAILAAPHALRRRARRAGRGSAPARSTSPAASSATSAPSAASSPPGIRCRCAPAAPGIYAAAPLACLLALVVPGGRVRRRLGVGRHARAASLVAALPTVVSASPSSGSRAGPIPGSARPPERSLGFAGAGLVCAAAARSRRGASTAVAAAAAPEPLSAHRRNTLDCRELHAT